MKMSKSIKALLLAAGFGTRLHPITLTCPKCLVEVKSKPIIEHWLQALEAIKCQKVIVNTHYLNEKVETYLANREKSSMEIQAFYEKELLGTGGTLLQQKDSLKDSTVLLIHADNYTNFELQELIEAHKKRPKNCIMTMLTFTTSDPTSCGIVEVDKNGVVQTFHEKVENPPGNLASGAVFVFDSDLINLLITQDRKIFDFSAEVIPKLLGKIYAYKANSVFIDIGTPERLAKARQSGL